MAGSSRKRIHVGFFNYTIDETNDDFATVSARIKAAIQNKELVEIAVLDDDDRPLTLYLNGGLLDSYALDAGGDPRPTEISLKPRPTEISTDPEIIPTEISGRPKPTGPTKP